MRLRERISLGFGIAASAAAVLLIGSAYRWAQAIVAVLVLGALIPQITSRRQLARRSPLVAFLGLAFILTLLSLIPLPTSLLEALDPTGTALRQDGAELLGLSTWSSLTRDVSGSLRALTFFTILLAVAVVALRVSTSEKGRYRLLGFFATLCASVAVIVGIHELLGATKLYGVYTVEQAKPSVLGPLLNENHLGGLMAIGTYVSVGLAMYSRQATWLRAAWVVAAAACGGATTASGSRGALVALIAGGIVTGCVLLAQRLKVNRPGQLRRSITTSTLPIAVVAVCVVVVVVYSGAGKVTDELGKTTMREVHQPHSKFAAWSSSTHLISEAPWFGVGRGGFESSFTRVHPTSGTVVFSFVENEYLQVVVDWGICGAVVLGLALLWFGAIALRRWRDGPLAAGALGALAAIGTQSTVDFGIELLGLAVPLTAIAATVTYLPLREPSKRRVGSLILRIAHCAGLLAAAALLLSSHTKTVAEDHKAIASRATLEDVRQTLERHPLDYFGYAIAADVVGRTDGPRAIRLLNHALRLHPTHPDLHRMAARMLYRGVYRQQAIVEYRLAFRASSDPMPLLREITERFPSEEAAAAIPTDLTEVGLVLQLLHEIDHDSVAAAWLSRVVEARPRDIVLCSILYEFSLGHGDTRTAEVAARQCVELLPDHHAKLALATLLARKNAHAEVIGLLGDVQTWHGVIVDKVNAWLMLCDAYAAGGQIVQASTCLHQLEAADLIAPERHHEITERLLPLERGRAP